MRYDFYQKVKATGVLIKMGESDVPDGRPVWYLPEKKETSAMGVGDPTATLSSPMFNKIEYRRSRTITGDIFIAEV